MSGEALKVLLKGTDTTDLIVAGGVAIGLLMKMSFRFGDKHDDRPYQFLTELSQAQSISEMTFPLGLER